MIEITEVTEVERELLDKMWSLETHDELMQWIASLEPTERDIALELQHRVIEAALTAQSNSRNWNSATILLQGMLDEC